jgi:hypothetical protein
LALANQLRLEAAGTVAGDRLLDLPVLGQYRLRARAVATVAAAATGRIAVLGTQMLGQLSAQCPFNQSLL